MNDYGLTKELSILPTPYYLYDLDLLSATLITLKTEAEKYNYKVHYAVKANNNDRILQLIQSFGFGADCVSGAEVEKVISHGFNPANILLAGAGKTDAEIEIALRNKISCVNCESLEELNVIAEIALKNNFTAKIALRINPNVDAQTHTYITTGLNANKFGISENELEQAIEIISKNASLNLCGLHVHIGSQINDQEVFKSLCKKINTLKHWFTEKNIRLEHINVGGGLGINYNQPDENLIADFANYFSIFHANLELNKGEELQVELGRSVVAQCGSLVSKVLYSKEREGVNFLILDAGMTELMRPALYQAYHHIEHLESNTIQLPSNKYTIAGPICESSDTFGKDITLPFTHRGDILIIRSAGAYGEVMSSNYNLRKKAATHFIMNKKVSR